VTFLFIARHFTYFRNFDSVIEALAARGHHVHLAADRDDKLGGRDLVDALASKYPTVTVEQTPIRDWGRYRRVAAALRLGLDYLRYTDDRFSAMPKIRQRAYDRTPAFVLALSRLPGRRLIVRGLEWLEEAVPRQAGIDEFITAYRPDLVLITPLIELGSPQIEYVRAARRYGVRSALCVWSWDHLSSKALIRVVPDAVLVWNEIQKEEAARFHGIEGDRVIVTGAQCFDRWFDRAPARDRSAFCRRAGLASDRPFLLYVCSALFRGSPSEAAFVRRWVAAVRGAADPALRDVQILVRPHPQRLDEWADGPPLEQAVLWGANPVDDARRADYFDSLYHSAAVIGLNTSALIEAAIVDKPVFTVLEPEFWENQQGTHHFQHLLNAGGGLLHTASSLADHVQALVPVAAGATAHSNHRFVERFLRPRGVGVAATPVFVESVERLAAAQRRRPVLPPAWIYLLRPVVYALVLAGRIPWLERIFWNPAKVRQLANV
jgi:hypothetical protein